MQVLRSAQDDRGAGFPDLVLLTVRDEQISDAAASLTRADLPPSVVLHTSGALGSDLLQPLAAKGWATGSMAPIVSIADPERDAPKLIGAWFAVEGDDRAVEVAGTLIGALEGRIIRLDPAAKPSYHVAAVFASNYVVTLLAVAERLMADAGLEAGPARAALAALAGGAVANVGERGAEAALTGPVSRGDADTIERHLARLSPPERRLYSELARETLEIARRRGLEPERADRIARILEKAAE
ncbi:MAG TPA: DUF2520 domain-containing protein [Longimicrobiaceae bacterium]|nr:DUF2520 domain-containing protein [Longimicrobiaceae bacterium]